MAKQDKKKTSRIKTKKKSWYSIIAPKVFAGKVLGESYLADPENSIGRYLKINLKDISGNVKDQNAYIQFKITGVDKNSLQTAVTGYQLTPAYIKRMVRKNIDRVDDYFTFTTKDGKKLVLKTIMTTIHKTHNLTRLALRNGLEKTLQEDIGKSDYNTFVANLVGFKIQIPLKKKLSKIYPLKEVAIRVLQLKDAGGEAPAVASTEAPETAAAAE